MIPPLKSSSPPGEYSSTWPEVAAPKRAALEPLFVAENLDVRNGGGAAPEVRLLPVRGNPAGLQNATWAVTNPRQWVMICASDLDAGTGAGTMRVSRHDQVGAEGSRRTRLCAGQQATVFPPVPGAGVVQQHPETGPDREQPGACRHGKSITARRPIHSESHHTLPLGASVFPRAPPFPHNRQQTIQSRGRMIRRDKSGPQLGRGVDQENPDACGRGGMADRLSRIVPEGLVQLRVTVSRVEEEGPGSKWGCTRRVNPLLDRGLTSRTRLD